VYTTVDSRLQEAATAALRSALMAYDQRHGYRGPERELSVSEPGDPAQWTRLLGDLGPVGGLRAALVTRVEDKQAFAFLPGIGEVELPWEGLAWARAYRTENVVGPQPKSAGQVLKPGDLIRVREVHQEDKVFWQLAQVPDVEGALVALAPADGAILALSGGFDFYRSKFNRAVQAQRQPGSNFKPFVYSAALDSGLTPATIINDAPVVFDDPGLEAAWRPENYSGRFYGPTRLREALTKSRNLVSIRILRAVGVDRAIDYVARLGFDTSRLPRDLSLALGSGTVTPLELATGYAVFANGGFRVEPYFIERVLNSAGEVVFEATPARVCSTCEGQGETESAGGVVPVSVSEPPDVLEAEEAGGDVAPVPVAPRVITPQNAWLMTSIMGDVIRRGTGRRALVLKRGDLAGKTGTTNDQRDTWFSGFNQQVVTTVWVGFDRLLPLGRGETGARAALPMWIDFMRVALEGVPELPRERPKGLVTVRIDPDSGQLATADNPRAIFETFRVEHVPRGTATVEAGQSGGAAPPPETVTEQLF
jgi:penicillin-binding protein 1A